MRPTYRQVQTLMLYKIAGQHSLNYPLSFLFRYLERLVRSLVYLPLLNATSRPQELKISFGLLRGNSITILRLLV